MLNPHLDVAGANFVFVALLLAKASVAIWLLRVRLASDGYGGPIYRDFPACMALGSAIFQLGLAARIGGWLPWRPMLYAGDTKTASWWAELAWTWTDAGALAAAVGLTIMFWPRLSSFRHAVATTAIGAPALVIVTYAIGYVASWWAAGFFTQT